MRLVISPLLTSEMAGCVTQADVGRRDYQEYCVAYHGDTATGNGWAAGHLARKPTDLTSLSKTNNGEFPTAAVIDTIDGYTRRLHSNMTMPEFGPVLEEGDLVRLKTGPGVFTPTPTRLVSLAAYFETLQK